MNYLESNIHKVKWTQDKINSFWKRYTTIRKKHRPELNWFAGAYEPLHAEIKKYSCKNSALLDIGCGGGYSVAKLTKEGFYVVGLEADKHQLSLYKEYCKKNKVNVRATLGLLWHLPFKANSFDCVYSCDVIEHIIPKSLSKGLREIYRVLKPKGYLFVLVPKSENMFQNMALCPDCGAWFHRHQHLQNFDEKKLRQLLEKSKFDIIELFSCAEISDSTNKADDVKPYNLDKIIAICQK